MANNFGGGSFTFLDFSRESSNMGFNTGAITATSLPGTLTQFGALKTALGNISLGVISAEALYVNRSKNSNIPPTDVNAQRERKWLVSYEDATEFFDPPDNAIPNAGYKKLFDVEVPCAKFTTAMFPTNSDDADLTETNLAAFVTAFEALVKSPYGGAVNVVKMTGVGRST